MLRAALVKVGSKRTSLRPLRMAASDFSCGILEVLALSVQPQNYAAKG